MANPRDLLRSCPYPTGMVLEKIRRSKKDKLVESSGGKLVVADVSTASATIIKANDARGVAVTST